MKNLLVCFCLFLFLASCSKPTVVVVPEACLQSDSTEVKVDSKITFTDCSEGARGTWLQIYTPGKKSLRDSFELFNTNHKYTHTFSKPGEFIAVLTASGDTGAPLDTAFVDIKVVP